MKVTFNDRCEALTADRKDIQPPTSCFLIPLCYDNTISGSVNQGLHGIKLLNGVYVCIYTSGMWWQKDMIDM